MSDATNVLDVSPLEKKKLRVHGIKVKEMHHHSVTELQALLGVSKIRAMELYALSEFQSLPSIGIRFAHDMIAMGYYSLRDVKGKNGAKLTDQFERHLGAWADPCQEDQFRLIVHYAQHPTVHRNWWDFTAERRAFREQHGYPANRPTQPWFELPRYQAPNQVDASLETTKKDLAAKLKRSVAFMKKHLDDKISLAQLADSAHLSSYHYLRCFKSVYEVTPLQYLTHMRLKKASQLLRATAHPIADVAARSGFDNESSFIRLYKREFQITPAAFRNRAKSANKKSA
jgi:AraC-like DNA-binding protein